MTKHKHELAESLVREDWGRLLELARHKPGRTTGYVIGRLYTPDEEDKLRAVRALGALVGDTELMPHAKVYELLRRFHWALSDESGAVPYGVPEAMGEVLVARPEFQDAFVPILCSLLTHEDMTQTGPIERGVFWALERLGAAATGRCPDIPDAVRAAAAEHPEAETRQAAAVALERLSSADAR